MSAPVRKNDPSSNFDPVANKFFEEGEAIDKLGVDSEPNKDKGSQVEAKEKKPGRFEFISKFFKKTATETEKLKAEIKDIKDGKVGAEEGVVLTDIEKKAAEKLERDADTNQENTFKRRLVGDIEDQLEIVREIGRGFAEADEAAKKKSKFGKLSEDDARLYRNLINRGSKYENGKYTNVSDEENARLRELEGPVLTDDVFAKMVAGEIPWTTNGIYKAGNLLYSGKAPATGKRFTEADAQGGKVLDFNTGNLVEGAAAAIIGAAALSSSHDGKPSAPATDTGKTNPASTEIAEKTTVEKYTEIIAQEYKTRLDEALKEQTRLKDKLSSLKDDLILLENSTKDQATPIKRADAIKANSALIAEYARHYAILKTTDDATRASLEAMSDDEYLAKIIDTGNLVGDSAEYLKKIDNLYSDTVAAIALESANTRRQLNEIEENINKIEDKLVAYDPGAIPEKSLRRRIIEVNAEIAYLTEELAKETDPESKHAKELAASIAEKTEEKARLDKAAEKIKTGEVVPTAVPAKELSPEEIMNKAKDEYEAELKGVGEYIIDCRKKIDALKKEPASADRDKKLYWENIRMEQLEEEGEVMKKNFAALLARIKEAGLITYSLADYGSSASHDASPTEEDKKETIAYSPMDTGERDYGTDSDDEESTKTVTAPSAVIPPASTARTDAASAPWTPVEPIEPSRYNLAADIAEGAAPAKNDQSIYRTTKADGISRPPNPDTETMVKETYKLVHEILAARKETYREDIADGNIDVDELKAIKEKLLALSPEEASAKVLAASKNKKFVIKGKNFNLIAPFAQEIFGQIISDTDELIGLAEKNKTETKIDKNESTQPIEEARANLKNIAVSLDSKDINELTDEEERLKNIEPDNLRSELIKLGCINDKQAEVLDQEKIFTIRYELVAAYKKAIAKKQGSEQTIKTTSVQEARTPAKTERENTTKLMAAARENIKNLGARLDAMSLEEIKTIGKATDEAKPEEIPARLAEAGIISIEESSQLKRDDIFNLRLETVKECIKAFDKKEEAAKTESKTTPREKEPKKKTESDLLIDKAKEKLLEIKNQGLAKVAEFNNDSDLVRAIEQMNRTIDGIRRGTTKEEVINNLSETGVLTKDELTKLNDRRLSNLSVLRIKQITEVKEAAINRRAEISSSPDKKEPPTNTTPAAPKAPRPPEKPPEKEPTVDVAKSVEAYLNELNEKSIIEAKKDVNFLKSLDEVIESLQNIDEEGYRTHLVKNFELPDDMAATLTTEELGRLRGLELFQAQEAYEKAKRTHIKEMNMLMDAKGLVKGFNTIGEKQHQKYTTETLIAMYDDVKKAKENDLTAIGLIKLRLDEIRGENKASSEKAPTEPELEKKNSVVEKIEKEELPPIETVAAKKLLPDAWFEFVSAEDGALKGGLQYLEGYLKNKLGDTLERVAIHPDNAEMVIVTVKTQEGTSEVLGIPLSDSYRNVMKFFDLDQKTSNSFAAIKRVNRAVIFRPGSQNDAGGPKIALKGSVGA